MHVLKEGDAVVVTLAWYGCSQVGNPMPIEVFIEDVLKKHAHTLSFLCGWCLGLCFPMQPKFLLFAIAEDTPWAWSHVGRSRRGPPVFKQEDCCGLMEFSWNCIKRQNEMSVEVGHSIWHYKDVKMKMKMQAPFF